VASKITLSGIEFLTKGGALFTVQALTPNFPFRRQGYLVLENPSEGADGGIDLRLRKNGQMTFVQCKHWKSKSVGVKIVRELYGVMTAAKVDNGILATFGNFTQEAKNFAKGKPIHLIAGNQLVKLISEVQKSGIASIHAEFKMSCPKCGSEMVLRTAKKGKYAGQKFWGCTGFPG
jgi:restriction system protein